MAFSMFPRLHHLTYDPWIWLKVTSMASIASNIKSAEKAVEVIEASNVITSGIVIEVTAVFRTT